MAQFIIQTIQRRVQPVAGIIADVRACGDDALLALTAKYDGLTAGSVDELAISGDRVMHIAVSFALAAKQPVECFGKIG